MEQIEKQVKAALENPQHRDEINAHAEKEMAIIRQFLDGVIGADEYSQNLETPDTVQEIICYSPIEFVFALMYIKLSVEDIVIALEHELAHYSEAIVNGLGARFCLRIYRTENGMRWAVYATQININLNNSLDDKEKRSAFRSSIAAPKTLSFSDAQLLL